MQDDSQKTPNELLVFIMYRFFSTLFVHLVFLSYFMSIKVNFRFSYLLFLIFLYYIIYSPSSDK